MATFHTVIMAVISAALVHGQRPSFAGSRPIGFPELQNKTTTTVDPLGNRFGEVGGTTERLPLEANGDRDLIDRISKFPIDQQPFWYLNWKALEEQRKNPQTYPQRPSQFAEPFNPTSNSGNQNSVAANSMANSNVQLGNRNGGTNNSEVPVSNVQLGNNTDGITDFKGHRTAQSNAGHQHNQMNLH